MRLAIILFLLSTTTTTTMAEPRIRTIDSFVPSSTDVQYNCEFENIWTRDRHPRDYPTDAVHWSRQVLASHDSDYNMWKEGSMASTAIQSMAEGGGIAEILDGIESRNLDYEIGYAKYLQAVDPTLNFKNPLKMTSTNHYVSVISKMSPSPDWFSGFHDFNTINEKKQTWYKKFTIETYPYDAGTEDGNTYDVLNSATRPQQPISEITVNNAPGDGLYLNDEDDDILPVARYTCNLNTYSSTNIDIITKDSSVPSSQDVYYQCEFENQWNEERHPNNFPNTRPQAIHWTKQILASHGGDYHMWIEGELASKGVESVAKSGGVSAILRELQNDGDNYDLGYDKYLYSIDPKVEFEPLPMTSDKPYVSAISKLAPSPDWFSGFHDFNAVNEGRDTWFQEFVIPVYPFDAGTEDGESYESMNSIASVPQQVISQFNPNNLPDNKVFLSANGDGILPVATYSCVLSDEKGDMLPTQPPQLFDKTSSVGSSSSQKGRSQQANNTNNIGLIIGLGTGLGIAAIFGGFLTYYLIMRRKSWKKDAASTTDPGFDMDDGDEIEIDGHEIA